jgi:hypothetical protein
MSKANILILEWIGSICGLTGSFLLATNTAISSYGWLAFIAANIATIGFAVQIRRHGLLVQQIGFIASSLLGLYRSDLGSSAVAYIVGLATGFGPMPIS